MLFCANQLFFGVNQLRQQLAVWRWNAVLLAFARHGTIDKVDFSEPVVLNEVLVHGRIVIRNVRREGRRDVLVDFSLIQLDAFLGRHRRKFSDNRVEQVRCFRRLTELTDIAIQQCAQAVQRTVHARLTPD